MAKQYSLEDKAEIIASFTKEHLIDLIRESGDVAAECLQVSRFLNEHTYGMAFWEHKINFFKDLEGQSILDNVTYAQNDLRFLLDGMEVRCHRVDPKTRVPLGGRKLKLEAAQAGEILLPGFEEFIISTSTGTPFIGVVADKIEGVQEIFVGLLNQVGKSSHCTPLAEVFNIDAIDINIDVAPVETPQETRRLATRTKPNKVASNEG
jgi:hypothetical protein